ncbi:unnamed protein product [Haemonchus placei]|uniref:Transporter n=1 Tax=Haemonchus placei TaxID=6290 RepID=A0A0N4WW64_HAEPC|nr:unnamed protein product [Haemonchus placei]
MDGSEWKAALRLQIEALARRNDLHRRCNRDSIRSRTAEMDIRIVKLRELVASDANYAAQFYLECVCHADETERILNRSTDMSLTCLGFIVGIGNMMRFPGKICEYGGIFFLPYIFCQIFIGFPMVYLHLCIGQYAGQTADIAFQRLMPITCGLGWAFVFAAIPVIIYHNTILVWSLQYLWYSVLSVMINEDLPWENRLLEFRFRIFHLLNSFLILTLPQRHIVLALTAAWLLVFAGVCRSTTWMAWATRITATIPYLMLFILLVRGLSLPGAGVGLTFLFSSMWAAAAEQVLFEISVGTGALFSIAAYSRFRNNVYRDAALLITMNVLTSLLVGMVLFSFLGLLSISSEIHINKNSGNDPFYMVFTVIPSMTKLMRWGPLWMSILFATIVFTGLVWDTITHAWSEDQISDRYSSRSTKPSLKVADSSGKVKVLTCTLVGHRKSLQRL